MNPHTAHVEAHYEGRHAGLYANCMEKLCVDNRYSEIVEENKSIPRGPGEN